MHNLKVMRVKAKMNQFDLAKAMGVTRVTISNWETGRVNPSLPHVKKLSVILNCTVNDLLEE